MKVEGAADVFAAGDVAAALVDGSHTSVMSCQHARPMGRVAGHNIVCDLVGQPQIPLNIGYYVTCLDLGQWGAVFTQGWDRQVTATGADAKQTKQIIGRQRTTCRARRSGRALPRRTRTKTRRERKPPNRSSVAEAAKDCLLPQVELARVVVERRQGEVSSPASASRYCAGVPSEQVRRWSTSGEFPITRSISGRWI